MAMFIRTFTNATGETWRYDFELLSFEQLALATSLFNYEHQQLNRPARSLRELELSGRMEYLLKGMAYLLVRVRVVKSESEDGHVQEQVIIDPWERRTSYDAALSFLRSLKGGSQWKALEEAKADFFNRANIVDLALLQQLNPFIESAMATASSSTTVSAEPEKSVSVGSETNDTTIPESLIES